MATAKTWHSKSCTLNVNKSERKELFPILRYCPSIVCSEGGGKLQHASVAVVDYQSEIQIWDVLSASYKVQYFTELAKQDYLHLLQV